MGNHLSSVGSLANVLSVLLLCGSVLAGEEPKVAELPPPEDLQARVAAFRQRNEPDSVARLAREFFGLTFLDEWHPQDFRRPGRWKRLGSVRELLDKGDAAAALDAFKAYTLEKLRDPDASGVSAGLVSPFASKPLMRIWRSPLLPADQSEDLLAQAKDLMQGVLRAGDQRLHIGEPGAVNWKKASESGLKTDELGVPQGIGWGWPWTLSAFNPLLAGYILTGDAAYLKKWAEYADDWAMNQLSGFPDAKPCNLADVHSGGGSIAFSFLRMLSGVAMRGESAALIPSATFARVMKRLVEDYMPLSMMYHRSCAQNWTDASVPDLMELALLLDEYRIAPLYMHEALRRLELVVPTRHFPDGTETELVHGYCYNFLIGAVPTLDFLHARWSRVPIWMTPAWERTLREQFPFDLYERELREEMQRRARFYVAYLTAAGELPIGGTRSNRGSSADEVCLKIAQAVPEMLCDPTLSRMLALMRGRGGVWPSYTSERYPYAGYTIMRGGWGPKDPYAFMLCASHPGHGNISDRDNNAFGLSAFGQDLLVTGELGPYSKNNTPVLVDGKEQYFWAGISGWGHRGQRVTAWHDPAPWRWHTSAHFDVAEGVYAGPYGRPKDGSMKGLSEAARAVLRGVTHQRLLHYVREAGLWIATDRLRSGQEHEYTLDWRLPLQPSQSPAFTAEEIKAGEGDTVKTESAKNANVSLYHFPSASLRFATKEERQSRGYRIHDFFRVSASWKAKGESLVVTAIYPRETVKSELAEIKPLRAAGTEGFEATTPTGFRVLYQAAANAPGKLSLDGVEATGESLLLVRSPQGVQRGIALGCTSLALRRGGSRTAPTSDFEFELAGGQLKGLTTIYTPIKLVTFEPDTDVLIEQQAVTLACGTPGVEIRYTLDGSDPSPASPLYQGPFTIQDSATVKARAFRPGLTRVPDDVSGTLVSATSHAVFTKAAPMKPVEVGSPVQGLHYEYYEGDWRDLFVGLDRIAPRKAGSVPSLLDISPRETDGCFAFKYSGFLNVPEDGVYTFHAPREWYMPDWAAGYELRVWVGGREWYPAARLHALGNWCIALQKGMHPFTVTYADLRAGVQSTLNFPDLHKLVWDGDVPAFLISGPGLAKQPIPASMLAWAARGNMPLKEARLQFTSKILRRGAAPCPVSISVKGARQLVLIANPLPLGGVSDAGWGDARLLAADGTASFLSDLTPTYSDPVWLKDKHKDGRPFQIGGRQFQRGLLVNPWHGHTLVYALDGKYDRLEATVGIDAGEPHQDNGVRFQVWTGN
jgi:hypothetical protein